MDINYNKDKVRQLHARIILFPEFSDLHYTGKILDGFSVTRSKGPDNGHQLSEFALVSGVIWYLDPDPSAVAELNLSATCQNI